MGLRVSMLISKVAYECPRLFEKSSTPSTVTCPISGSGSARTSFDQRVPADIYSQQPKQPGSRPARPAASAISSSSRRSSIVRRAYRWVSPGTGSANVRTRHAGFWQARRRTVSAIRTRRPPAGRSRQKPAVMPVHPGGGHAASPARRRSARRTRRHQHVIPVIGHLIDGQFREVGEEHRQAAGVTTTTCWTQGTMNLTAARVNN